MVAERGSVVAHHVVDVDGALAHQQLRDRRRGEVDISGVEQCHIPCTNFVPDLVDRVGQVGGTAPVPVVGLQSTVEVVGVENGELGNVSACGRGIRQRGGRDEHGHDDGHDQNRIFVS